MKPTSRPLAQVRDAVELGAWIRHARRSQGLSTGVAAELCGVSRRFVNEVEAGKPTAQVGKVLQLMTRLGLVVNVHPRSDRP